MVTVANILFEGLREASTAAMATSVPTPLFPKTRRFSPFPARFSCTSPDFARHEFPLGLYFRGASPSMMFLLTSINGATVAPSRTTWLEYRETQSDSDIICARSDSGN